MTHVLSPNQEPVRPGEILVVTSERDTEKVDVRIYSSWEDLMNDTLSALTGDMVQALVVRAFRHMSPRQIERTVQIGQAEFVKRRIVGE